MSLRFGGNYSSKHYQQIQVTEVSLSVENKRTLATQSNHLTGTVKVCGVKSEAQ